MRTLRAPRRTAERAQSTAVLPPPSTTTSSPNGGGSPWATRSRNPMPASACSSPGQRSPCRSGAIRRRIAATEHHYVVAQRRRIALGHALQKPDARQRVFLARAAQPLRVLRAGGHEHRVVRAAEFGEGEVLAPPRSHAEMGAECAQSRSEERRVGEESR